MNNIKMGLTIEEAAECTGIGRNTMQKHDSRIFLASIFIIIQHNFSFLCEQFQ